MMTHKGRVVYERIKHPFSYRDIARIARKVDPRDTVEKTAADMLFILDAMNELFTDLLESLFGAVLELLDTAKTIVILLGFKRVIDSLLYRLGYRPEKRLRKFLRP